MRLAVAYPLPHCSGKTGNQKIILVFSARYFNPHQPIKVLLSFKCSPAGPVQFTGRVILLSTSLHASSLYQRFAVHAALHWPLQIVQCAGVIRRKAAGKASVSKICIMHSRCMSKKFLKLWLLLSQKLLSILFQTIYKSACTHPSSAGSPQNRGLPWVSASSRSYLSQPRSAAIISPASWNALLHIHHAMMSKCPFNHFSKIKGNLASNAVG